MSRPSFHCLFGNLLLTGLLMLLISGCGGSSADSDTQAAAGGAGGDTGAESAYPGDGGDYGGEAASTSEPGAAYGGGAYGGGRSGQGGGAGYGGAGYPGSEDVGYEGGIIDDGMGAAGYGGEPAYPGGGYAGDMSGYGAGMSGYGGGANPQFGTMIQFVRQNCVQCHGPQLTKGDTRLDRLTANFEDQPNATLWDAVQEQLESGQMPPKSIPRRPDPAQQQALVSWIKTSLRDANYIPLEEQDYLSQAQYAFASNRESEAVKLLYAHTLAAEQDAAQEILSQAKWSTVGMRPVLTLRFAVGVILSAPEDLKDLSPLASTPSGAGGGGYGGESYDTTGGNANTNSERTFQQLTGEFGEALATNFEKRWVAGSFGTIFKDIEETAAAPAPSIGGGSYGGPGYTGGEYGGYDGGMNFGGEAAGMGGENGSSQRGPVTSGSRITPGLIFIGTGNQAELLTKAAELGVDGLFVFDVKAEQDRRRGFVNNDTRMRLVSLNDAKTLAATSTLNNIDIARNKARGVEDDSLDKNIQRFFAMFDERVRLESLPPLKAEHAHSRMRQLLVDQKSSNLSKLFEARLYHSLDLLSDEELSMLYQIVLRGNAGVALASGTVDDRRLVLDDVLTN